jgi:predicted helicase
MEMGVFYTPLPVVRFIVRGIDSILKSEFGIAKGIADNSLTPLTTTNINHKGEKISVTKNVHKVQLLDIATGTGTFLNETVLHIHESMKSQ